MILGCLAHSVGDSIINCSIACARLVPGEQPVFGVKVEAIACIAAMSTAVAFGVVFPSALWNIELLV